MKESLKTSLIILLYLFVLFKGVKELLWVERESKTLNDNLELTINYDEFLFSLFTDHPKVEKRISIYNNETDKELKLSFVSTDWDLYFFLDSESGIETLSIVDRALGKNSYAYDDLTLLTGTNDCFATNPEDEICNLISDDDLLELGEPVWIYTEE